MQDNQAPKTSIWGEVETAEKHAEGVYFLTTPGHGGYYLTPEQNAKIPLEFREATFMGNGMNGWYEEDCDAAIIHEFFNLLV